MFAKLDEIPSMILQDIKETKRYGHTFGRSVGRSDGQRENSIYPPTNTVCGGIKKFTDRQTDKQTSVQKRQKLYSPYILRIPGV